MITIYKVKLNYTYIFPLFFTTSAFFYNLQLISFILLKNKYVIIIYYLHHE